MITQQYRAWKRLSFLIAIITAFSVGALAGPRLQNLISIYDQEYRVDYDRGPLCQYCNNAGVLADGKLPQTSCQHCPRGWKHSEGNRTAAMSRTPTISP